MQITQATAAELNGAQFPSLRFRFDKHPGNIGEFAGRRPLTVGPVEFGRKGHGAAPGGAHIPAARRVIAVTLPAVLEVVKPGGEIVSLPGMSFDVYETPTGELVYSNSARSEAWEISISSDSQKKQMTMFCRFSYAGLNVKEALNNVRFLEALASGGELRILKSDDRTVLGRARVA